MTEPHYITPLPPQPPISAELAQRILSAHHAVKAARVLRGELEEALGDDIDTEQGGLQLITVTVDGANVFRMPVSLILRMVDEHAAAQERELAAASEEARK